MFNDDSEYASTRLLNSVVRARDFEKGVCHITRISSSKAGNKLFSQCTIHGIDKNYNDVRLDPSAIEFAFGPLGYITTEEMGLSYVIRSPIRRDYKQGLRSNQLQGVYPSKKGDKTFQPFKDHNINSKEFLIGLAVCAHNKYPKIEKCIELVEETGNGYAMSRHFAIGYNYTLNYRGEIAGELLDSGLVKFKPEFHFLEQEFLSEVGNEWLAKQ